MSMCFLSPRRFHVLSCMPLFFILIILTRECIGNERSVMGQTFFATPIGIGVRSAFHRHFSNTNLLSKDSRYQPPKCVSCQNDFEQLESSRYASITGDEIIPLGWAQTPNIIRKTKPTKPLNDELDNLLGGASSYIVPCSARRVVIQNDSSRRVETTKKSLSLRKSMASPALVRQSPDSNHGKATRGGTMAIPNRPLIFWESMICGAISRSVAQTVMHPANTMKTILQSSRGTGGATLRSLMHPKMFRRLTTGAGANFFLSVPTGAVNFAVLELVRQRLNILVESVPVLAKQADTFGPALDFVSSAISTIVCSVVSTPQMMITDNIMAGNYPNLPKAITGLYEARGAMGFYSGWWPGLVGKIPSYVRSSSHQYKRF